MSFTAFQRLVAQLTLDAIADLGFALGGGQALHAHGYGDRLSRWAAELRTQDIDDPGQ